MWEKCIENFCENVCFGKFELFAKRFGARKGSKNFEVFLSPLSLRRDYEYVELFHRANRLAKNFSFAKHANQAMKF